MTSSGKIIAIDRKGIVVEGRSVRIALPYREGFKVGQEVDIIGVEIRPAKHPIAVKVLYDSAASDPPYRFIVGALGYDKAGLLHELLARHGIKADTIDFVVHNGPFTFLDGEPTAGPNRFYTSRNQIPVSLNEIVQRETDTGPIKFIPMEIKSLFSDKKLFDDMWDNPSLLRYVVSDCVEH